jgi:hypothetical protein
MLLNARCTVGIALALFLGGDIHAQEDKTSVTRQEFQIIVDYFVCVKPSGLPCMCGKEQDKKTCPKCEEWTEKRETLSGEASLKPDAYSYKTGPPRANVFISDVARQIYGKGLPKNDAGHDITLEELYKNPQKYGWIEVPSHGQKTGALVVWPSVGGLVVSDNSQAPGNETSSVEVVYPSDKKQGQLNKTDAKFLDPGTKPKYLVPAPNK